MIKFIILSIFTVLFLYDLGSALDSKPVSKASLFPDIFILIILLIFTIKSLLEVLNVI